MEEETANSIVFTYVVIGGIVGLFLTFWATMLLFTGLSSLSSEPDVGVKIGLAILLVLVLGFLFLYWYAEYALYTRKHMGAPFTIAAYMFALAFDAMNRSSTSKFVFSFWRRVFDPSTLTSVVYNPMELIYVVGVALLIVGMFIIGMSNDIHVLFAPKKPPEDPVATVRDEEERNAKMEYY